MQLLSSNRLGNDGEFLSLRHPIGKNHFHDFPTQRTSENLCLVQHQRNRETQGGKNKKTRQ